ncbi:MAG: DUF3343 domain-containing protein [Candidatus Limivicinus sp.]|jgi:hypothetical protein
MTRYIILCRSLTYAQRAQKLLEHRGFTAELMRSPQKLNENGCGYCLNVHKYGIEAAELLKKENLLSGKVYKMQENGEYAGVIL